MLPSPSCTPCFVVEGSMALCKFTRLGTTETAVIRWTSLSQNIILSAFLVYMYFFTLLVVLTIADHVLADSAILCSPPLSPKIFTNTETRYQLSFHSIFNLYVHIAAIIACYHLPRHPQNINSCVLSCCYDTHPHTGKQPWALPCILQTHTKLTNNVHSHWNHITPSLYHRTSRDVTCT